jgi:hypothetical protein
MTDFGAHLKLPPKHVPGAKSDDFPHGWEHLKPSIAMIADEATRN